MVRVCQWLYERVRGSFLPLSVAGTFPDACAEWPFLENTIDHEVPIETFRLIGPHCDRPMRYGIYARDNSDGWRRPNVVSVTFLVGVSLIKSSNGICGCLWSLIQTVLMTLAPPAFWSGPRPTRSAARSRPPRAEATPLPATCRWPCSLLRSQPNQPSHGRGNASSRPFGNGRWGGRVTSVITCLASRPVLVLALPDMLDLPVTMGRKRCSTTAGLHWPQLAEGR